jgi:regulatory protein
VIDPVSAGKDVGSDAYPPVGERPPGLQLGWVRPPGATGDSLDDALGRAYRFLGHRDRSVAEIRQHLLGRNIGEATVEEAIATLESQGYLDDARLAQRFAEDRRTLDAWGAERIERRLSELGVDRELIAAALAAGGDGELGAAVGFLRRRFPVAPGSDRERDRALKMLVRKGYALEVAYDAVNELSRDRDEA